MHQAGHRLLHFGLVMSGTVQVCMDDINGNNMIIGKCNCRRDLWRIALFSFHG